MAYISPYLSQQPVDDFGLGFPSVRYSANLAATTNTSFIVPGVAQHYKALIKAGFSALGSGNGMWFAIQRAGTPTISAAVPSGATFAATTSEFLSAMYPVCREVSEGDIIHFFSPDADTPVSIVLYSLKK